MKTTRLFLAVLVVFAALLYVQVVSAQQKSIEERLQQLSEEADKIFPEDRLDFSAAYLDGTPVSSDALKDTNVFYVFGGANCGPCIALGKLMTLFVKEKKYDPQQEVKFLFITSDDLKWQQELTGKFGIDPELMVYIPTEKESEIGIVKPLRPLIVFVDRDGNVVFKSVGFVYYDNMDVARRQFEVMFGSRIGALLEKQQ